MINAALAALEAQADPGRAVEMQAYHKIARRYLGLAVPAIEALVAEWRAHATLDERLQLCADLWATDIHEARIAAAKLLTQARIRPDDAGAWALICAWVPQLDAWAIADHVCIAGQKRVVADPSRLDVVASWTTSPLMWTRRAALVITLPFTKSNHPKPWESAARDRVLGWCALYADVLHYVGTWVGSPQRHGFHFFIYY